mmetsp:Transcript_37358/g.74084  ORF Transcript_37358/g.74084 Transcript_37358/m.74084 type:complete len:843 (-) Transcript_37358:390-2918(-)
MAAQIQVDIRQGGLRSRWQHSDERQHARKGNRGPSEAEITASSFDVSSRPPPIQEGQHRWAGPGASWPTPRVGSYTSEQFTSTLPSERPSAIAAAVASQATTTKVTGLTRAVSRPQVHLVWHKQNDLRIHDHEPVSRAHLCTPRLPIVHLHVFDPFWFGRTRVGGYQKTGRVRAAFWRECVQDLRASLRSRNQDLFIRFGMSAGEALGELAREVQIIDVFTYQEVCSEELMREAEFKAVLEQLTGGRGRIIHCWGYTLHHIEDVERLSASAPSRWITPYLSFGAFKKDMSGCRVRAVGYEWQDQISSGEALLMCGPPAVSDAAWWGEVPTLVDLGFSLSDVAATEVIEPRAWLHWLGGESTGLARLEEFIWGQRALQQYVGTTDWSVGGKCTASRNQTSKLSPYLAFGCLSPRLVYWEAIRFEKSNKCKGARGLVNSLMWRDFYRFIVHYAWGDRLFHLYGPMNCGSVPGGHKVPTKWCCKHYNNLFGGSDPRLWTWGKDREKLQKWTDGITGYPFVDAAMLELKSTGFMQHLNREVVGWFFVRDLQLDWRLAAEWFESCLIDYDCVLNWGNWVYFILTQLPARIDDRPGGGPRYTLPVYSPFLSASQVLGWGREHDPTAAYVKRWLPALACLPAELAREPWRLFSNGGSGALCTSSSVEPWSCMACTLINSIGRRNCEACGSRRPLEQVSKEDHQDTNACMPDLDVYADLPIIPPPPWEEEEAGARELCAQCGHFDVGWAGEDGGFFCESCWEGWSRQPATVEILCTNGRPPSRTSADIAKGWELVPRAALPAAVGAAAQTLPDPVDPGPGRQALNGDRKRGARWTVRGSRSALVEQVLGA